jgi:class 3 adenylate cyclase
MARLTASARAKLPDSAFAYVDARGHRRLPINDEAHVRNALARFDRVIFEDDAARERARTRLLRAAKRYGIVPVGFITGQLASERKHAGSADVAALPTGRVTFLLTDIEGSTAHLDRLRDGYAGLLRDVRGIIRRAVLRGGGHQVDARADEFFAVFKEAAPAVEAALGIQRALAEHAWPDDIAVRVRAGIHTGRPTLTESGYIGLSVHTAARACSVAHGGQIVVSDQTVRILRKSMPAGVRVRSLGRYQLQGLPKRITLYQLGSKGLMEDFPPLRYQPT